MAEEIPGADIQALVDAAVKEAVAKSIAEMARPRSRQEINRNDAVIGKGADDRKAQNQNLGQQEAKVVATPPPRQETERKVVVTKTNAPAPEQAPRNGFNPREFLYAASIASVNHPWKVYNDGTFVKPGSPEILGKYRIIGGTVYSQGGSIDVPDQELIGGAGEDAGYVYLEITRDESSREVTGVSIEQGDSVPADDYTTQYRPLAVVYGTSGKKPLQLQFQEIRIWEYMLVENGEFELHTFDMNSRTSYAPP